MKTGERRQTKIEYFELELKLVTARPRKLEMKMKSVNGNEICLHHLISQ
jgi:hypothetical protein